MMNTDNSETTARAAILGLSASFQSIRLLVLEVMSITLALRWRTTRILNGAGKGRASEKYNQNRQKEDQERTRSTGTSTTA